MGYNPNISSATLLLAPFLIFTIIPNISYGQFTGKQPISNYDQIERGTSSWQDADEDDRKDPMVATRRALLHTFAPIGAGALMTGGFDHDLVETGGVILIGYGLIYGPSQGNLYAEDPARGMTGIAIRAGSVVLVYFLGASTIPSMVSDVADPDTDNNYTGYEVATVLTGMAFAGSMVYNLLTADNSAREYNEIFSGNVEVNLKTKYLRYTKKSAPALSIKLHF